MYNIGPFITYLKTAIPALTFILPTKAVAPAYPYVTIVYIVSNQDDIYQRGTHKIPGDSEQISFPRYSQYSLSVIGLPDTSAVETYAQTLFNLMKKQSTDDFFSGRNEVMRLLSSPEPRFLVSDNFNQEKIGFDIEIGDIVTLTDDKAYIETLTITDTDNKIGIIEIEDES